MSVVFAPKTQYTVSVAKSGAGSGTVTSYPAGINCGLTCSKNVAEGSYLSLSAEAAVGSVFAGWSGDCTGTDVDCSFSAVDGAKSVKIGRAHV